MQLRRSETWLQYLPEVQSIIVAGGECAPTVGAESDGIYPVSTPFLENAQCLSSVNVPETQGVVGASRESILPVRTDSDAKDRIRMPLEGTQGLTSMEIPEKQTRSLFSARERTATIGADSDA